MGVDLNINLLLPQQGLWERISRILYTPNLESLIEKHESLYSWTYGARFKRLSWEYTIQEMSYPVKYVDEQKLKRFCLDIEGGTLPLNHQGLIIQLGKIDDFYRPNEQLFLKFMIDTTTSHAKEGWCRPDQVCLRLTQPTGDRNRSVQDQNCIRPLISMVFELLQPNFVFSCLETAYDTFYHKPYQAPWQFYWDTMIFGPELVNQFGLEHLRQTPAFRLIELEGPMIWISSISGFGDEDFSNHRTHIYRQSDNRNESIWYGDNSLSKLSNFMARAHYHAICNHLGLKGWEKTYLPLETEAQQKFLEWMIQYWRKA